MFLIDICKEWRLICSVVGLSLQEQASSLMQFLKHWKVSDPDFGFLEKEVGNARLLKPLPERYCQMNLVVPTLFCC